MQTTAGEKEIRGVSGWLVLFLISAIAILSIIGISNSMVLGGALLLIVDLLSLLGLTVVNPNTAKVVTLFGRYKGTIKKAGFWWVIPFSSRRRVSLRVRNFESGHLKVNDH